MSFAALALVGSDAVAAEPALYEYGTIDGLLAGVYDGQLTVKELGTRGDFGLGTYNRLDGEMVLLDGKFWHAHSDGSVSIASASTGVPLAYVMPFKATDGLVVDEKRIVARDFSGSQPDPGPARQR